MIQKFKWLWTHPASRGRRVRNVVRYLWWQMRQRITSEPYILNWYEGSRLEIIPHGGLTGYLYVGMPDFEELTFFQQVLRNQDLFLDVGANAGAYSVLAATRGCVVHAFEPVPQSYQRLLRNFELNKSGHELHAHQNAVGSTLSTLTLTTGHDTGNRVVEESEEASVEVESITLDHFMSGLKVIDRQPIFMKVDVEGYELEVVKGALQLLDNPLVKAILMETFRPHNFAMPKLRELEGILASKGFLPYEYRAGNNQLK